MSKSIDVQALDTWTHAVYVPSQKPLSLVQFAAICCKFLEVFTTKLIFFLDLIICSAKCITNELEVLFEPMRKAVY